jgi:hypothetical protein
MTLKAAKSKLRISWNAKIEYNMIFDIFIMALTFLGDFLELSIILDSGPIYTTIPYTWSIFLKVVPLSSKFLMSPSIVSLN